MYRYARPCIYCLAIQDIFLIITLKRFLLSFSASSCELINFDAIDLTSDVVTVCGSDVTACAEVASSDSCDIANVTTIEQCGADNCTSTNSSSVERDACEGGSTMCSNATASNCTQNVTWTPEPITLMFRKQVRVQSVQVECVDEMCALDVVETLPPHEENWTLAAGVLVKIH